MRSLVVTLLILGTTAVVVPAASVAGIFRNHCCCHRCQRPCGTCNCAPAAAVPQTSYQPVVETQYVQQPTTTYRDVTETQYRTEAVNETVPQVSYDNVTVDEGSYQTVWVPRQVVRAVPRTTYQTRTSYRQVPYQVTRRVAEQTMQSVPTQSVRYVPSTTTAHSTCNTCNGGTGMISSGVPYTAAVAPYVQSAQAYGTYTTAIAPTPVISSVPVYNSAPTTAYSSGMGPVPDARFSAAGPTPVTPRTATSEDGFQPVNPVSTEPRTAAGGPSLFVPAPSAAQVWRTPRNTVIR